MFSTARNSCDFSQCIAEKKIVLVNGGEDTLGPAGMATFLQFIVGQYYAAAFKRGPIPEQQRHLAVMLIDEAAYVFKNALVKDIFSECRKFSCGLFAATQLIEQMSAEVKAGVYGATAIRFASSVSDGDATALAKEMYCDRDFIRSMKSVDNSHAEWAVQVEGLTNKQAIRLTLPFGIVERAAKMSAADLENVLDLNHVRLTADAPLPTRFHGGGHFPGGTPKSNSPRSTWNSDDGDTEEL